MEIMPNGSLPAEIYGVIAGLIIMGCGVFIFAVFNSITGVDMNPLFFILIEIGGIATIVGSVLFK